MTITFFPPNRVEGCALLLHVRTSTNGSPHDTHYHDGSRLWYTYVYITVLMWRFTVLLDHRWPALRFEFARWP